MFRIVIVISTQYVTLLFCECESKSGPKESVSEQGDKDNVWGLQGRNRNKQEKITKRGTSKPCTDSGLNHFALHAIKFRW
jgi:hypothetical protein